MTEEQRGQDRTGSDVARNEHESHHSPELQSAGARAGAGAPWAAAPAGGYSAGPSWSPGAGLPVGGPHPDTSHTVEIPAQRPRRQRTMAGVVAAALIAGLVGGGAGFAGAYALLDERAPGTVLTTDPGGGAPAAAPAGTVAAAAAAATPSTVDIRVVTGQGAAEGSGVILTSDGAVLTNNHVVAGGSGRITVTLADGTEHTATVVGTAPSYDLAVLRLDGASGLTAAALGSSADLQVGQQVVAIGSPQGLTGTVTTGIVSAFDRTVAVQGDDGQAVVYNGLQTDTPINQGNSGGPLVDLEGRVVGINSAIATADGGSGSIGLGFAIPIDQARRVAQEILDTGSATKPVLGVTGSAASSSATGSGTGAVIASVQDGSAAAQAGLAAGDTVTEVGDDRVEDFADLIARIGARAPGETVTLTVQGADGAPRTVDVTLGSTEDEAATSTPQRQTSPFGGGSGQGSPFGGSPSGN